MCTPPRTRAAKFAGNWRRRNSSNQTVDCPGRWEGLFACRLGDRGLLGVAPFQRDDLAVFDSQRQPSVLKFDRSCAEQVAAPSMKRGDIGAIVGGDHFEI